jgi:hypothetical protein
MTPRTRRFPRAIAFALGAAACAPPDHPREGSRSLERCGYDVSVDASLMLHAEVRCDGPIEALTATELAVVSHLVVSDAARDEGHHRFSAPVEIARYSVDLAALAAESGDPDVAYAHEGGSITAVSSWLLRPEPSRGDTRIEVAMTPLDGASFATGLRLEGEHHWLEAREIAHATYAVMGRFERDLLLVPARGGEARLELATLPGPLRVDAPIRRRWIGDAAAAVGVFWRGFPVDRALVAIVPTQGHPGVAHGKVVAAGGASVALLLGTEADEAALRRDWILVHELFHLGFPSFVGEGKWLDEGLATYYEPIIRARAGWLDERALWLELAAGLPLGRHALEREGLENSRDAAGVYWGGALAVLMADVRVRAATGGARGLEDGLIAVLADGGDASRVHRLGTVIGIVDEALGMPVLADVMRRWGQRAEPVPLESLLADLGVARRGDAIVFDEAAPLAAIRRAIVHPPR